MNNNKLLIGFIPSHVEGRHMKVIIKIKQQFKKNYNNQNYSV